MTERKRRGQNKPNRQATKDYRNNKKDSESNKTKKVSEDERHEPSSLKREQATATTAIVRNEFIPEVFYSSSNDVTSNMKDSIYIRGRFEEGNFNYSEKGTNKGRGFKFEAHNY